MRTQRKALQNSPSQNSLSQITEQFVTEYSVTEHAFTEHSVQRCEHVPNFGDCSEYGVIGENAPKMLKIWTSELITSLSANEEPLEHKPSGRSGNEQKHYIIVQVF